MTLYHKAKLEMYAENVHEEGLVCRLTLYLDQQRSLVKEKREHFKNRVDRLRYRIHYPMERKVNRKVKDEQIFCCWEVRRVTMKWTCVCTNLLGARMLPPRTARLSS